MRTSDFQHRVRYQDAIATFHVLFYYWKALVKLDMQHNKLSSNNVVTEICFTNVMQNKLIGVYAN